MAKEKSVFGGSMVAEFFHFGVYKQSQGRIARQITWLVITIGVALASYKLWLTMKATSYPEWIPSSVQAALGYFALSYSLPIALMVVGTWVSFRVVCLPKFADFLIAVEAEMNKVSWPSRGELVRSSLVVIGLILLMALLLWTFDIIWFQLFTRLGVLQGGSA